MKQQHIHQELLVFTSTSLSHNILCETNSPDNNENDSQVERLEQACWNGVLNELFPEVIGAGLIPSPKMFIWGIYEGNSFLLVDLADTPDVADAVSSIDPYLFVRELKLN